MSGNQSARRRADAEELPESAELLRSGDMARHSGLYRIEDDSKASNQQLYVVKGMRLPVCPNCHGAVHFRLVEKIPYIAEDPDFC